MKFQFNRKYLDYLYWIFPVIFMGLAFIAISEDRHYHESGIKADINIKADTSLTVNSETVTVDSLTTQVYDDGTTIPLAY